jgi:SAM-dependent methyltransferase
MMGIFNRDRSKEGSAERVTRHSRGWADVRAHLKSDTGLRVLDFGSTSPANINFLTSLGHGVYMSNLVQEATKPEWLQPLPPDAKPGAPQEIDVDRFIEANLDFAGRDFDVVLLWDTANYLPPEVVPALFARLAKVLRPGGRLLAFFHSRMTGPETAFSRYQLTDTDDLLVLESASFPVRKVYQVRQVENLIAGYSAMRFFVGRDNVRELIAVR